MFFFRKRLKRELRDENTGKNILLKVRKFAIQVK